MCGPLKLNQTSISGSTLFTVIIQHRLTYSVPGENLSDVRRLLTAFVRLGAQVRLSRGLALAGGKASHGHLHGGKAPFPSSRQMPKSQRRMSHSILYRYTLSGGRKKPHAVVLSTLRPPPDPSYRALSEAFSDTAPSEHRPIVRTHGRITTGTCTAPPPRVRIRIFIVVNHSNGVRNDPFDQPTLKSGKTKEPSRLIDK